MCKIISKLFKRMTTKPRLFINDNEVDLADNVDILFTYQVDDLTNPSIVKNSYSKNITLPGTPNNNKIFTHEYRLDGAQDIGAYNASKRTPFTIYVNNEVYESGYMKLLDVKRNGNDVKYDISLFGGLGSFLYNLSYNEDDTKGSVKKKLSDLWFKVWDGDEYKPSETELDFTLNKETIDEAWNRHMSKESRPIFEIINFMPDYGGYPDDFDADKVLINFNGLGSPWTTVSDDYRTYNSYAVAELPYEFDGSEMREFRSWHMRPVINVQSVIGACCDADNNGGYEVNLYGSAFFGAENPYYDNLWMTLPSFSEIEYGGQSVTEEEVDIYRGTEVTGGSKNSSAYTTTTDIEIDGLDTGNTGTYNIMVSARLRATVTLPSGYVTEDSEFIPTHSRAEEQCMAPSKLYCCALHYRDTSIFQPSNEINYPGAIEVQLLAYGEDGRIIAGSDLINLTSLYTQQRQGSIGSTSGSLGGNRGGGGANLPTPDTMGFTPEISANYTTKNGGFDYNENDGKWYWDDVLSFTIKQLPRNARLKLKVYKLNREPSNLQNNNYAMNLWQRHYDYSVDGDGYLSSWSLNYRLTPAQITDFDVVLDECYVTLNEQTAARTGAKIRKQDLLNTDYTPAEFLLSYCKLFGLYMVADKYEKKITIMPREHYYHRDEVVSLEDKIDTSQEILINPINFQNKWYKWQLAQRDSQFADLYKTTYGNEYGSQRVNTGYNFDASENDILKGNVFKGGIEALEKSNIYMTTSGDTYDKAWTQYGLNYKLYKVSGSTYVMDDTTDITINPKILKENTYFKIGFEKYYDIFSRLQFHDEKKGPTDGSQVLVMLNTWFENLETPDGYKLKYWITDDTSTMMALNDGNSCWILTQVSSDAAGNTIAIEPQYIPHFTRCFVDNTTIEWDTYGNSHMKMKPEAYVQYSMDMGHPQQQYVPNYVLRDEETIYMDYWQKYTEDIYDIDTRKLTCYVKFDERPVEEWLRRFYWFRNGIWRINKITDYNVLKKGTTKVEFIKVQDRENYSNEESDREPKVVLTPSMEVIPKNGATITVGVWMSSGGNWEVNENTQDEFEVEPVSGRSGQSFTVVIPRNDSDESIERVIQVDNDDTGKEFAGYISLIQEGGVIFNVEEDESSAGTNVSQDGAVLVYNVTSEGDYTVYTDTPYTRVVQKTPTRCYISWQPSKLLETRTTNITFTSSKGESIRLIKAQAALTTLNVISRASITTVEWEPDATVSTAQSWIHPLSRIDGGYDIMVDANPYAATRSGLVLFIVGGGRNKVLNVVQEAATSVYKMAINTDRCVECGACSFLVNECPMGAFKLKGTKPYITDDCLMCGLCESKGMPICPTGAFEIIDI